MEKKENNKINWTQIQKEFDEKFPITKNLAGYKNYEIIGSARKYQWISLEKELKSFLKSSIKQAMEGVVGVIPSKWGKNQKLTGFYRRGYNEAVEETTKNIKEKIKQFFEE